MTLRINDNGVIREVEVTMKQATTINNFLAMNLPKENDFINGILLDRGIEIEIVK